MGAMVLFISLIIYGTHLRMKYPFLEDTLNEINRLEELSE